MLLSVSITTQRLAITLPCFSQKKKKKKKKPLYHLSFLCYMTDFVIYIDQEGCLYLTFQCSTIAQLHTTW